MTRATEFLRNQDIPFEIAEYEPLEKGAVFASQAIGVPLEKTIKTLVVELSPKAYVVVLMPGNKSIPFKKLARICGVKRAAMVDAATAERLSGYLVGGISPFAMRHRLPSLIDAELLAFDSVSINGGKRGLMLIMSPSDILKVTAAEPVDL